MGAAKVILADLPDFCKEVPYQVKKIAIKDAFQALSNGCKKAKTTGAPFNLRFRSRKNPKQSCFIPHCALKDSGIYPKLAGKLKRAEPWSGAPKDSRLVFDKGRWFCLVPAKVAITRSENQARVVAIDPGVRTFATLYSEDGAAKIGDGDYFAILRRCYALDDFISRMSKAKARKRRRLKKAANALRTKIQNMVTELYFKLARMLVNSFDLILLPTFETKAMARRHRRKIRSKSARSMLTWLHFAFKQRLKHVAKRSGKAVLDVCEAYTSKTASWTGEIKPKLGGARKITSGGQTMDRDLNGARGIFLRALVDNPGSVNADLAVAKSCNDC